MDGWEKIKELKRLEAFEGYDNQDPGSLPCLTKGTTALIDVV